MMFHTIPAAPMDPVERLKVVREETERITPDDLQNLDQSGLRWTGSFRSDPYFGFPYGVFTSTLLDQPAPPNLIALRSGMGLLEMDAGATWKRATDWQPHPGNLLAPPPEISFVATHVPSVQAPVYLCGHRCLQQVVILPAGGNLGYAVTILSYNHDRYVAMTADPRLMPDLYLMKGFVQTAFEELQLAAEIRPERRACKTAVVGASP